MPAHRLDPLLQPCSVAVVGASDRGGSPGNEALVNLRKGGYEGVVYAVNPTRDNVMGLPCFPSLSALPEVPQHVVFAVNDSRLEACFDEALQLGVGAATIFSAMVISGDSTPGLAARIQRKALAAGMLLHGGNCMGFFNFSGKFWISGFDTRTHDHPGNAVLLSQSGAGMSGILDCEERLDFLFAASTGQELCLSMEDYLDYALDLPATRVIGLFLETSRHPDRFIEALEKAQRRRIPIVAVKVGRTELAARLAISHSGALAGSDKVFDAVFRRYGVQRVDDLAQLAATLILFGQADEVSPGGLATMHDSGGERQLAIDLAARVGVEYAELDDTSIARLQEILDTGLPAVNPLDAWGNGGPDAGRYMAECFTALMADPGIALGAVVHDRAPGGGIYESYLHYLRAAREATGKPVCLVANCGGSGSDALAVAATREGTPVLDGLLEFQVAARSVLAYSDFLERDPQLPTPEIAPGSLEHWRVYLRDGGAMDEARAGQLLRDFGIPVEAGISFHGPSLPESVLQSIRYPAVLKTARVDIAHKSDAGGVILNLDSEAALRDACAEMTERLGPALLVAPMVRGEGVEMILGVARDSQFGPTVLMGFGGVHAELLDQTVLLMPPFAPREARGALRQLKMERLLESTRGRPAVAIDAFCRMASRLSLLAVELVDCVAEIDINPVKVMADGCIGLDALVVPVSASDGPDEN